MAQDRRERPAILDPRVQRDLLVTLERLGVPVKQAQQEIKVRLALSARLEHRGLPVPKGLLDPRAIKAYLAPQDQLGPLDLETPDRQDPPDSQA